MHKIKFLKSGKTLEAPHGANLFQFLNDHNVPVASSCGGEGVCTKCIVKIVAGRENLSREGDLESDMRDIHDIDRQYRMSCQTEVLGNITIDADYW